MDTIIHSGMGSHLRALQPTAAASCSDNDEQSDKITPPVRQKRKYRCRVRSPSTIERAKRTRRDKANARERRRMNSLNDALEYLRSKLPQTGEEPKMTKIETLKTAQMYIDYLYRALAADASASATPFASPIFDSVPTADLSTERLMFAHLFQSKHSPSPPPQTQTQTQNHSHNPNHSSYSTHYTPDPSPAYPPCQYTLTYE